MPAFLFSTSEHSFLDSQSDELCENPGHLWQTLWGPALGIYLQKKSLSIANLTLHPVQGTDQLLLVSASTLFSALTLESHALRHLENSLIVVIFPQLLLGTSSGEEPASL